MAEKILIVTGDGGESYEVLYALHRFQEAGYTTDIAAPSARSLHLVQHDLSRAGTPISNARATGRRPISALMT
ncbi:MAG: hypothetical protein R3F53_07310 [Gammaproteobacteria bacterium]